MYIAMKISWFTVLLSKRCLPTIMSNCIDVNFIFYISSLRLICICSIMKLFPLFKLVKLISIECCNVFTFGISVINEMNTFNIFRQAIMNLLLFYHLIIWMFYIKIKNKFFAYTNKLLFMSFIKWIPLTIRFCNRKFLEFLLEKGIDLPRVTRLFLKLSIYLTILFHSCFI